MGLLDDLKHKAEELGDKAKEGFDAAKDKAGDLVDSASDALGDAKDKAGDLVGDVRDRLGHDDDTQAPLTESEDVSADAGTLNPTDVGEEDDADPVTDADTVSSGDLDGEDVVSVDDDLDGSEIPTPAEVFGSAGGPGHVVEPGVESDVDPYDTPLTESIGDAVAGTGTEDPRS